VPDEADLLEVKKRVSATLKDKQPNDEEKQRYRLQARAACEKLAAFGTWEASVRRDKQRMAYSMTIARVATPPRPPPLCSSSAQAKLPLPGNEVPDGLKRAVTELRRPIAQDRPERDANAAMRVVLCKMLGLYEPQEPTDAVAVATDAIAEANGVIEEKYYQDAKELEDATEAQRVTETRDAMLGFVSRQTAATFGDSKSVFDKWRLSRDRPASEQVDSLFDLIARHPPDIVSPVRLLSRYIVHDRRGIADVLFSIGFRNSVLADSYKLLVFQILQLYKGKDFAE
jgi:hypothetical protein